MERLTLYYIFLLLIPVMSPGVVSSQVIVQFTSNNNNNLNLQSIWNFQVTNLSGNIVSTYMEIKITNSQTDPVVTIQTPRIDLVDGMSSVSNEVIKNSRVEYSKTNPAAIILKKDGYFTKGLYYICVLIKDIRSDAELGQNCTQANITVEPVIESKEKEDPSKKENFFSKNVRFSGYSEITGVYSNMQPIGSTLPPSYLQWYLNPTLSVYGFPVSFQLLLSTRQMDTQQNINSFNVQFDANQFKNMLMQRAMAFIKEKTKMSGIDNLNIESLTGQFNTVKGKLEDPGALAEMAQIKELDSLKGSLANLQNMGTDSGSIFNKINQLKTLTGNDSLKLDTNYRSKLDSLKVIEDAVRSL